MLFIPLTEWNSINFNDTSLDESVGTDQFVVGSVVDYFNNTSLGSNRLGSPRKVSRFQTKSTELGISTSHTDRMNSLCTNLGVGSLTTQFKLSLLSVVSSLGTGCCSLVSAISANTYKKYKNTSCVIYL